MNIFEQARTIADRLGIEYPPDMNAKDSAYFVGYWSRVAGDPCPAVAPERLLRSDVEDGWNTADRESPAWEVRPAQPASARRDGG